MRFAREKQGQTELTAFFAGVLKPGMNHLFSRKRCQFGLSPLPVENEGQTELTAFFAGVPMPGMNHLFSRKRCQFGLSQLSRVILPVAVAFALIAQPALFAQGRGGRGGRGGPPQSPKAGAPIDLTGYWVSVVTEDWRYRMVTPAPGDYQGVPMTQAAVKVADAWDPAKEEASGEPCKSYGAPAILRVPENLHFTWTDDNTLQMETDAGKQSRTFHFGNWKAPEGPHTLQGNSVASWEMNRDGGKVVGGTMKVETTDLKAGFLRKNGVPYSDNTTLTEYYDLVTERNGDTLLVVTIVTTDPMYLREPFIISSHFRKMPDNKLWKPSECSVRW